MNNPFKKAINKMSNKGRQGSMDTTEYPDLSKFNKKSDGDFTRIKSLANKYGTDVPKATVTLKRLKLK